MNSIRPYIPQIIGLPGALGNAAAVRPFLPLRSRRARIRGPLCGFVLWLGLCAGIATAQPALKGFVLEVEAANEQGGIMELYYDVGYGYSEHDVVRVAMPPSATLQPFRFALPLDPVKRLRFDPAVQEAVVRIGQIRLLTDAGEVIRTISPARLCPTNQIKSITFDGQVATIRTVEKAFDPMTVIDEPLQAVTQQRLGRTPIGPPTVLALGALVALLLALATGVAFRGVWDRASASAGGLRIRAGLISTGIILVVAGVRLFCLWRYSGPMPFWDEWDSDALYLLMPLRGGYLDWHALFVPQGEHRILVTRLITLVGTICNGEWDPRLGMVAGVLMFAASIGLVSAAAMRAGRWPGLIASALIAAFAALPYDANNLFWGGQSQMYALNFLAIGTLAIAAGERLGPLAWLGGAAAGSVSLVTMGSGFVAPGLAAGICAVRFIFEPARRRDLAVLALVFGAIAAAGLLAREDSRWHAFAYARTATKFWRSFLAYATWPLPPHWASVAVVWLPWLAVGIWTLARRAGSCLDWLAIGVGAWALVNVIGLAYARPDLTPPFDSKYNTALSLAAMASVLSSCALSARLRRRRWLLIAPVAASLAVAVGMTDYGVRGMAEARFYRGLKILHNAIVRPYLATGDRSLMVYFAPERSPYWNCAELAIRLDSPLLQPVLPSPLRKVLATRPGMHVPGLLEPGPLTLDARTLMKTSPLIFAIGLALIVLGLRRRPAAPGAGVANTPKH